MTTPLSPAAQAVLDAFLSVPVVPGDYLAYRRSQIAAALRATADQVASPIPDDCTADVFNRQIKIRAELTAIAAELEGPMADHTLQPCPCGATPQRLSVNSECNGSKWAWCACGACGEWSIEFRTGYSQDPKVLQSRAAEAWNRAPRAVTTTTTEAP